MSDSRGLEVDRAQDVPPNMGTDATDFLRVETAGLKFLRRLEKESIYDTCARRSRAEGDLEPL